MNKILAGCVLFAFLAKPCMAPVRAETLGATYYVATTGADGNDGSSAHPWRTIQHGADMLAPGDTLLIQPGTYSGGITVDHGGTAAQPITFRGNGAGVVIDGSSGERDAFFITDADYVVVDGLTIQRATRAGMRIDHSNHVSVRNSTFANNPMWGVFTDFSNYTLIENSESYGATIQHGIYISNSSDFPTIRHNRLHDNAGCGLHMNGDISMQPGDGIISYGLVEGNIIYGNGTSGGSGINMDGVTDTIVRNNLLYNNHASGISLYQIDGGSGSKNDKVLNNTILMPADGRWAINVGDTGSTNDQVFNNILYSQHAFRGSITIPSANLAGFVSDYNLVVDRLSDDTGDTNMSLAAWQIMGYDKHSFIATPAQLFVNLGSSDYHLLANSPAIDRGKALSDVTDDLEGHARPSGAGFDLGAYEFTPSLALSGAGSNQSIALSWVVNASLPPGATWQIEYSGPAGNPPSPILNLSADTRSYRLMNLTNDSDYAITLSAAQGSTVLLSSTIHVTPRAHSMYLPLTGKH